MREARLRPRTLPSRRPRGFGRQRLRVLAAVLAATLLARRSGAGPAGPGAPAPVPSPFGNVQAPTAAIANAAQIVIRSGGQERENGILYARDFVHIQYRDLVLEADYVELNEATKDAVAVGNVVLQEGDRRLAGERLELNLETRLGSVWTAWGHADPDIYFTAKQVRKVGDDKYELKGSTVTSCTQPRPQWRIRASGATFEVDKWVRMRNARLEVFGVPLLYVPFIQYPANQRRSTGFLVPSIGTNNQRGFYIGNGFFWAIGRSYDATVYHEYYKQRGSLFRGEFVYIPSVNATGAFSSENFADKVDNRVSSRYHFLHNQRFASTWRIGADVNYATDETLDREFTNSIGRISQRTRTSNGFLAREWGRYSLSAGGAYSVVLGSVERSDLKLPNVDFAIRDTRLAGPLYGRLRVNGIRYGLKFGEDPRLSWERFDLHPNLSLPLRLAPWLQFHPQGTYRLTYYTKSYAPGTNRQTLTEQDFTRRYGSLSASLVGPVFSRVFNTPGNGYSEKWKHVIEPSISYDYTSDIDIEQQAFQADAIDRATMTNQVGFALRNLFFAKRRLIPGAPGVPYEFLRAGVSMNYSLDRTLGTRLDGRNLDGLQPGFAARRRGPLVGEVRFVPSDGFSVTYRAYFDTLERHFSSQSVQGTWRTDRIFSDVSYSRDRSTLAVTRDQLRGMGSVALFGRRVQLGGNVSYDVLNDSLYQLGSTLIYHTQCCGLGVAYNRLNIGLRNDTEYRFSVNLKNVGTVFDYTLGDKRL